MDIRAETIDVLLNLLFTSGINSDIDIICNYYGIIDKRAFINAVVSDATEKIIKKIESEGADAE